jgi:hypothetical protein
VNGGKHELNKAKRDLLNSTKSLSKALKSERAKGKQVLALQLANKYFEKNLSLSIIGITVELLIVLSRLPSCNFQEPVVVDVIALSFLLLVTGS